MVLTFIMIFKDLHNYVLLFLVLLQILMGTKKEGETVHRLTAKYR